MRANTLSSPPPLLTEIEVRAGGSLPPVPPLRVLNLSMDYLMMEWDAPWNYVTRLDWLRDIDFDIERESWPRVGSVPTLG